MAEGGSPRKAKRTAEHQINKDEDPEGDGAGEEVVAGTFQRASAEVLKTRKIVKARGRPSGVASSAVPSAGAGTAPANPFASLGAAKPNPFQNVVLSTAAPAAAPAPAAAADPVTNGSGCGASEAAVGDDATPATATSTAAETPSSPTAAAAATAADEDGAASKAGVAAKDASAAEDAAAEEDGGAGRKDAQNGGEAAGGDVNEGAPAGGGAARSETGEDAAKEGEGTKEEKDGEKKPPPAAGVVSFAALGGGGGKTPFQSATTTTAPLSFGGFGSSTTPSPLGGAGAISSGPNSAKTDAEAGSTARPVLSFGSPAGTAGAFSSFTSFATAPSGSGGWGSPPKDGGKEKEGGGGGAAGAEKKKDWEGAASARSASGASATNPPLELMDPSDVVNGEELEECTFKARGKLFRLSRKEWVEKGIGNLKVLRSVADDAGSSEAKTNDGDANGVPATARLVMRREAGQQVMINVPLHAQTKCSMQGEKAVLLACFTPEGPATYLIKVKTPEIAESLKAAIDALVPPEEEKESAV